MEVISNIIGNELIRPDDSEVMLESLVKKNSIVGLYFSAHWCPPCRLFTNTLAKFYEMMKRDGKHKFEVIFVSCDTNEKEFYNYFQHMPWVAVPYETEEASNAMDKFSVRGIPLLILLDGATGEVITQYGREEIEADPNGKHFPYKDGLISEPEGAICDGLTRRGYNYATAND